MNLLVLFYSTPPPPIHLLRTFFGEVDNIIKEMVEVLEFNIIRLQDVQPSRESMMQVMYKYAVIRHIKQRRAANAEADATNRSHSFEELETFEPSSFVPTTPEEIAFVAVLLPQLSDPLEEGEVEIAQQFKDVFARKCKEIDEEGQQRDEGEEQNDSSD